MSFSGMLSIAIKQVQLLRDQLKESQVQHMRDLREIQSDRAMYGEMSRGLSTELTLADELAGLMSTLHTQESSKPTEDRLATVERMLQV